MTDACPSNTNDLLYGSNKAGVDNTIHLINSASGRTDFVEVQSHKNL